MNFEQTAPGQDDSDGSLRRNLWRKLSKVAARIPFAEDLLAAYYCAFDRATPLQVKVTLIGALAYFVLPFDAIPDLLPVIGFTDDAAVLATAIKMVSSHMTPEHREAARARLGEVASRPYSRLQNNLTHDLTRGERLERNRRIGQRVDRVHVR